MTEQPPSQPNHRIKKREKQLEIRKIGKKLSLKQYYLIGNGSSLNGPPAKQLSETPIWPYLKTSSFFFYSSQSESSMEQDFSEPVR